MKVKTSCEIATKKKANCNSRYLHAQRNRAKPQNPRGAKSPVSEQLFLDVAVQTVSN